MELVARHGDRAAADVTRPTGAQCTVETPHFQFQDEPDGDFAGLWIIGSERRELRMSRAQRRKSSVAIAAANQLDLFGGSNNVGVQSPKRQRATSDARMSIERSADTAPTAASASAVSPDVNPDRKLLDFVLGADRRRGRPPKPLPRPDDRPDDGKRLLDVREAAARLGLSKSTLDKMRCSGRGPRFIRATDRAVRYDPADLAAFAEDRRRRSTSEDAVAAIRG